MHEFMRASRLRDQIRVGTSGWSYDDWVGPFYPTNERPKWLDFYANLFPTVEVNSTYYRIPNSKLVDIWIEKGLKHEGFEYSLKFPRFYELDDLHDLGAEFENTVVAPISQNQLLGAILIQLTPYVKRIEHGYRTDNLEKLDTLLAGLHTDDYAYFVEFRHVSWLDGARLDFEPGTKSMLARHNVTPCIVDGPSFPTLTTNLAAKKGAYIRLHGRNTDEWFKRHRGDEFDRSKRYEYTYTEEELLPWKERISTIETDLGGAKPVWVYFNNHPQGNAPRNALMLMELLEIGQAADAKERVKHPSPTTLEDWDR